MPLAVVLDTNVLIAGLRSSAGASFAMLNMLGSGAFELQISVPLVFEYEAIAKREARALGLTVNDIDVVLDYLCSVGNHREIHYLWRPFLPDAKDDMVLELAVASEADYLVTHNSRDFAEVGTTFDIHVISPRQYLTLHPYP